MALMTTAFLNSPLFALQATWDITLPPPADWPAIVT